MNETSIDNRRPSDRYGYLICVVIFLSYLLVFFHRVCPSVIAMDMQRAFGVGGALLGVLGSAYFYPYAIMQLPVGLLVDSWGPRRTVSFFLFFAALGSILMGMADGISLAVLGRVLVGIGVSTVFVSNFKLLTDWFPPKRTTLLGGIFLSVGGVGALAASYPLAVLSIRFGWNWTLGAIGGVTAVMALLVFLVVRDHPPGYGPGTGRPDPVSTMTRPRGVWRGMIHVMKSARIWPLAAWSGFCIGITFAFGGMWSVPYLQHVYGMSKSQAGQYQTMFGLALIVASPALSLLANRIGRRTVMVWSSLVLCLGYGLLYVFTDSLPGWAIYLAFFLIFSAGNATGPLAAVSARELFHPSLAGTAIGLVNCFPFFVGGIMQVVLGGVLERAGKIEEAYTVAGYHTVFLLCFASAVVSLVSSWFIRETLLQSD